MLTYLTITGKLQKASYEVFGKKKVLANVEFLMYHGIIICHLEIQSHFSDSQFLPGCLDFCDCGAFSL